jgi:Spx/MgsR family transcriptional regulator
MIKIYGIKNCNTMHKASDWLEEKNIDYEFHDYKKLGITAKTIKIWLKIYQINIFINTKGTTYKKLSDSEKSACLFDDSGIKLMQQYTSMIKRPILEDEGLLLLGFNAAEWEAKLLNIPKNAPKDQK